MPALAITDLGNAFGLVKFYRATRAKGVKPVIGCDVRVTHEAERDQPFRMLLLAQSRAGYLQARATGSRARTAPTSTAATPSSRARGSPKAPTA